MLKRINSALSLFTTLLLFCHVLMSMLLIQGIVVPVFSVVRIVTLVAVLLHAVLSILILFLVHEGRGVSYPKNNVATVVQRASGVFILLPLFLSHNASVYTTPSMHTALFILLEIVFYLLVAAHVTVSVPRALVTLGALSSEKGYRIASVVSAVLSLALGAAGVSAVIRILL